MGKKAIRPRLGEPEAESAASGYQTQHNIASGESVDDQHSGLKTAECQTTFDLVGCIEETKRNAHRLEVKVQRLNTLAKTSTNL